MDINILVDTLNRREPESIPPTGSGGITRDRLIPNTPETWMTSQWGKPIKEPVGMPPNGHLLNSRYVMYSIIYSDVTNSPWADIQEEHWSPVTEVAGTNLGATISHMKKFYNWMDWTFRDTDKTYADASVHAPYSSDDWGYFQVNEPLNHKGQPWGTIHQQYDWWRWRASHLLNPSISDTYYDNGSHAPTEYYDWGTYDWYNGEVDDPNDAPVQSSPVFPAYLYTQYDYDDEGRVFRIADVATRYKLILHVYGRRYPNADYQLPAGFNFRLTDAQIDALAITTARPALYDTIPEGEIAWSVDSKKYYMKALKYKGSINNPFNTTRHTKL